MLIYYVFQIFYSKYFIMKAIKVDFNLGVGLCTSVWLIIRKDVNGCMEDDYDISYQMKKKRRMIMISYIK